jgi:SAM-dependent methyltransferase
MEEATVRGRIDSLPFLPDSFSFILCRLPFVRKEQAKLLQELGRLISTSGKLLITDLHPYSPLVQEEFRRNPVLEEGLPPSLERYLKVLGAGGFKIESIREVFLDATIKKTFGEKGKEDYERLRRSPFLLLMAFTKGR